MKRNRDKTSALKDVTGGTGDFQTTDIATQGIKKYDRINRIGQVCYVLCICVL